MADRIGRVVADYQAAYPHPLVVRGGEELAVGEKESEWPGWVWCTDANGLSGWVPEVYLARRGDGAVALCDYDATELSVRAGEALSLGQEVAGWVWCTNRTGQSGWVPAANLDLAG